jgi:hypothetical protein
MFMHSKFTGAPKLLPKLLLHLPLLLLLLKRTSKAY